MVRELLHGLTEDAVSVSLDENQPIKGKVNHLLGIVAAATYLFNHHKPASSLVRTIESGNIRFVGYVAEAEASQLDKEE